MPARLCGEEHAMNILASLGTLNDNLAERANLAVILNQGIGFKNVFDIDCELGTIEWLFVAAVVSAATDGDER